MHNISSCYLLSKSLDCEFDLSYITFLKLCNNPFCQKEVAWVETNGTFMMNISSYIFLFLAIMKTKIKRYFKCNYWWDIVKIIKQIYISLQILLPLRVKDIKYMNLKYINNEFRFDMNTSHVHSEINCLQIFFQSCKLL